MMDDRSEKAAGRTAQHLTAAVEAIDGAFGAGHAAANPSLVAAFLQSASLEAVILSGEAVAGMLDKRAERSVAQVCTSMENLRPRLFG